MIKSDADVLDVIPQAGAERALQVWNIQKPDPKTPAHLVIPKGIAAMARAILAYEEWRQEQNHETQMLITLGTHKIVRDIREARAKHRREAQELVSK